MAVVDSLLALNKPEINTGTAGMNSSACWRERARRNRCLMGKVVPLGAVILRQNLWARVVSPGMMRGSGWEGKNRPSLQLHMPRTF